MNDDNLFDMIFRLLKEDKPEKDLTIFKKKLEEDHTFRKQIMLNYELQKQIFIEGRKEMKDRFKFLTQENEKVFTLRPLYNFPDLHWHKSAAFGHQKVLGSLNLPVSEETIKSFLEENDENSNIKPILKNII